MFETIDRTRSGTSNNFLQKIKQSGTIIGKCARSTNVYMRHNNMTPAGSQSKPDCEVCSDRSKGTSVSIPMFPEVSHLG